MFSFYMPHGHCISWDPTLILAWASTDILTAICYFLIPIIIWIRFKNTMLEKCILWLGPFILACGIDHLVNVITIWYPYYALMTTTKFMTSAVSLASVAGLWFTLRVFSTQTADKIAQTTNTLITAQEWVDKIPFAAFVCDNSGSNLAVNQHFIDIFQEEFSGYEWERRLSDSSRVRYTQKWLDFTAGRSETYDEKAEFVLADRTIKKIRTVGYKWTNGWWGMVEDLSIVDTAQTLIKNLKEETNARRN